MEYWIQGTDIVFCDGDYDISTPNHECVVVEHYYYEILALLEQSDYPGCQAFLPYIPRFVEGIIDCTAIRTYIHDCLDGLLDEKAITEDEAQDVYSELFAKRLNIPYEEVLIAFGQSDKDLILYAQQTLGWIRVKGYNLDLWGITPKKLKNAALALEETPLDLQRGFSVEDAKTGRLYGIPYDDMRMGIISHSGRKIYEPKSLV